MNPSLSAPESGATQADDALLAEVAQLVVTALNLEVAPADIGADDPLYGEGLGLDSIDMLELALVVSKQYGLELRAEHEDNHRIFTSLRTLADHIAQNRTA
jgi:acyl carrier protein